MIQQVEAVYENGVLRPLGPVELSESQRVKLTIVGPETGHELLDAELLERARAEVAAMTKPPTIEELRAQLSTIHGSVAKPSLRSLESFDWRSAFSIPALSPSIITRRSDRTE